MIKNAILLGGGYGNRMQPFTSFVSKHLLNVAGKPIIDYPINTLKQTGVENLTIVVGSSFSGQILDYVQDGSRFGLNVNFLYQKHPDGISNAINICQRFVSDEDNFVVILGDNLFTAPIDFNTSQQTSAKIVLYKHHNIKRFGVASINDNKIVKIEEKPQIIDETLDNYAISGCYLFNQKYFDYFRNTVKSARNEFEITDIIRQYHEANELGYSVYDGVWLDAGTHESIALANNYFYSLNQIKNGTT